MCVCINIYFHKPLKFAFLRLCYLQRYLRLPGRPSPLPNSVFDAPSAERSVALSSLPSPVCVTCTLSPAAGATAASGFTSSYLAYDRDLRIAPLSSLTSSLPLGSNPQACCCRTAFPENGWEHTMRYSKATKGFSCLLSNIPFDPKLDLSFSPLPSSLHSCGSLTKMSSLSSMFS